MKHSYIKKFSFTSLTRTSSGKGVRPIFVLSLLLCSITLTGCHTKEDTTDTSSTALETFMDELFREQITSNTLTLHYTLKNPSDYGITDITPTLGSYDTSTLEDDKQETIACLQELEQIDTTNLSENMAFHYDVLHHYLENTIEGYTYTYYSEPLSPTTGIQAQLPVLLSEYSFYTKEDIDIYLALLSDVPDYFNSMLAFEQEKADKNLFMAEFAVQDICDQCNSFLSQENNFLISSFDSRLNTVEAKHPGIDGGLYYLKGGAEYYEYLARQTTGSDRSVEEMSNLLSHYFMEDMSKMQEIMEENPSLETSSLSFTSGATPEEMLEQLREEMQSHFPTPVDVNYTVKYVDKSMEDYLSPAFYLTPPIDDASSNVIYINNGQQKRQLDLYTTLAHEGYPGHLYQNTMAASYNLPPIRSLLYYGGYTEGWATYVELSSYELVDFGEKDKDITDLCQIESEISLCLSSIADIGINYKGWDKMELEKYLDKYGMGEESVVNELSELVIANPANYLQYYVSYLEFWNLRCKAKDALGSDFDSKDFHKVVLDCGPAPFGVIEQQVDEYIEEMQEKAS